MKLSMYNILTEKEDGTSILCNTHTLAVVALDQKHTKEYKLLDNGKEILDQEMLAQMFQAGLLINDDMNEKEALLALNKICRFSDSSLSLSIAPTLACNFKCPYCYEKGVSYSSMSESLINDIGNFFEETLSQIKELSISWYGGEPLLALNIIEKITKMLKNKINDECSYNADMVTNGYLLNANVAQTLKKLGVETVQVTLDGSKRAHDSRRILHNNEATFETILQNIKNCADIIHIIVRINVDKTNIKSENEIFDWFDKYDLKGKIQFYIAPVDAANESCNSEICMKSADYAKEEIQFYHYGLQRGYKYNGLGENNYGVCGAIAWNSFVIDPLGDLYKCWNDIGHKRRSIGNVKQELVINENLSKWLNYNPVRDTECGKCKIFPICFGGCAYYKNEKKCHPMKWNLSEVVNLMKEQKETI